MAKLDDLPSLNSRGGGFGKDKAGGGAFKADGSDGFDDFGFDDVDDKPTNVDSPSKLNDAEKHLNDFY